MASKCPISQNSTAVQEVIFRRAAQVMSLKAISEISGIPYSTLRSYAGHNGETAEMPVSAVHKLAGVIEPELLSLLLPDGMAIIRIPEGVDLDQAAQDMRDFLDLKAKAHHPQSPDGREISECESAELHGKVAQIKGAA
jgi:hypothetical protein